MVLFTNCWICSNNNFALQNSWHLIFTYGDELSILNESVLFLTALLSSFVLLPPNKKLRGFIKAAIGAFLLLFSGRYTCGGGVKARLCSLISAGVFWLTDSCSDLVSSSPIWPPSSWASVVTWPGSFGVDARRWPAEDGEQRLFGGDSDSRQNFSGVAATGIGGTSEISEAEESTPVAVAAVGGVNS